MADDEKEVHVEGAADVSGDVEGKVEFEASAKFTPGEGDDNPDARDELIEGMQTVTKQFSEGMETLFSKYGEATKDATRDTAKARVPQPAAFSRSGAVD